MKLIYTFFLLFLAVIFVQPMSAQVHPSGLNFCGTEGKSEWLTKYQAGEFPVGEKSEAIRYVPLNVVFVGEDNDMGYIPPAKFLSSMILLNSDFRDQNIQFFIQGDIKFLPSSRYNNHTFEVGREMMMQNNLPRHVNTYVVQSPAGNCGYYSGSADAVALGTNCLGFGDRTWSHEVGHFLTLPHTFYGWESVESISNIDFDSPAPATVQYRGELVPVERVDGSNCSRAADGFCDTEPDYLMQRWPCTGNGIYADSLLDPDSIRFAAPANNIMSYANDNCVSRFSPEQKGAMFANLDNRIGLVSSLQADTVAASVEDLVMYTPANNERLVYRDSVTLSWNAVPNADFYVVELNTINNFNASVLVSTITKDTSLTIREGLRSRSDHYWHVRAVNNYVVNGDFGPTFKFRNGSQLVATIDEQLNAAITIAPNPVSGGRELRISGTDLGTSGTMNYQLIDASGRVLRSQGNIAVGSFGFDERLDTGSLSAGIYFVRIRLNNKLVTRRIVVTP